LQVSAELLPELLACLINPDDTAAMPARGSVFADFFAGSDDVDADGYSLGALSSVGAAEDTIAPLSHDSDGSSPGWKPRQQRQPSWIAVPVQSPSSAVQPVSIEKLRSDWNLDVFALSPHEQHCVAAMIFEDTGSLTKFNIPADLLSRFIQSMSTSYNDNPYHNFPHALMVTHASFLLARAGTGDRCPPLTRLQIFALLIAALGHDVDHPGVNNAFLVSSSSPLAICYNDKSVLENHHAATTFSLLRQHDLLQAFVLEQRREIRKLIIAAILGTDMAHHHAMVRDLTESAASDRELEATEVVATFLHLADLSNCVVDWELSKTWAARVCEEGNAQAEREREMGLAAPPVVKPEDFSDVDLAQRQLVFLNKWVGPLVNAAALYFPGASSRIEVLEANQAICVELFPPPPG